MVKHTVMAALVGLGFCASAASAQTPTTTTPTTDPHMTINQRLENQHESGVADVSASVGLLTARDSPSASEAVAMRERS